MRWGHGVGLCCEGMALGHTVGPCGWVAIRDVTSNASSIMNSFGRTLPSHAQRIALGVFRRHLPGTFGMHSACIWHYYYNTHYAIITYQHHVMFGMHLACAMACLGQALGTPLTRAGPVLHVRWPCFGRRSGMCSACAGHMWDMG